MSKEEVTLCSICDKKHLCDIIASLDDITEVLGIVIEIHKCKSFKFRTVEDPNAKSTNEIPSIGQED